MLTKVAAPIACISISSLMLEVKGWDAARLFHRYNGLPCEPCLAGIFLGFHESEKFLFPVIRRSALIADLTWKNIDHRGVLFAYIFRVHIGLNHMREIGTWLEI
jgi:hypothetical protein